MSIDGANKLELLHIADSVAAEKMIDKSLVIKAIEEALSQGARHKYGEERNIQVAIDPVSGQQTVTQILEVTDEVVNNSTQISLEAALKENAHAVIGGTIERQLPPFAMGRIVAQRAKQALLQNVRIAERERQYEEFKDKVGTIVVGTVKREEYGNIIVDLPRGEAILRRDRKIGREIYGPGERLRAYIYDVRNDTRGPQIFLSRSANEFMTELFRQEVPEIYEGTIEIVSVAREPGSRAKIAVVSRDSSIDPVGACVGMRGSRVQTVVNELQGERIDVIPWTEDVVDFIVSALQPARVLKIILTEQNIPREVVVPDDQLSLAIGRNGQNVRLACHLTGFDISIITESAERERRQAENARMTEEIMKALSIDEVFARLLVTEGFDSSEILATSDIEQLTELDGIDENIAEEIRNRAQSVVKKENEDCLVQAYEAGLQDDLAKFEGLSPKMLLTLAQDGICTLTDFAYCADYELAGSVSMQNGKQVWEKGLLENCQVTLDEAFQLIVSARLAAGILTEEEAAELQASRAVQTTDENETGQAAAFG